jgi:hypothetical protein
MTDTEYLLVCLAEECAEAQKAVSKALRFGLTNWHPEGETTNAEDIENELCDVEAIVDLLRTIKVLPARHDNGEIIRKQLKVESYIKLNNARGAITPEEAAHAAS